MSAEESEQVDHINHNGLDNRRVNLRLVNGSQQQQNRRKHCKTSSVYKGVFWHKRERRWAASIYNKKSIWLGYFDQEIDAAKTYNRAAMKYFGEYACLNKI